MTRFPLRAFVPVLIGLLAASPPRQAALSKPWT